MGRVITIPALRFVSVVCLSVVVTGCESLAPIAGRSETAPHEIIVKYRGEGLSVASEVGAVRARPLALLKHAELLRLEESDSVADVLGVLRNHADVEYAEPNFVYHPAGAPNDLSQYLWGLDNRGQTGGSYDVDIDAPEAWDLDTGNGRVIVAVLDSGVDTTHPDLSPNIWRNPYETLNGIDDDGNGYVDDITGWDFYDGDNVPNDTTGHGTHIAGTIGARGNNGGLVGVNWNVQIMPLKFIGRNGGDTYNAIYAIDYAIAHGARVLNLSWASDRYSRALVDAIDRAEDAGVLIVAASGNVGRNVDAAPMYPAAYNARNIVSVTATNSHDRLASFSSWGASTVDMSAPGSEIYSTAPGGGYRWDSGTSMAAPHVAGVAALALSANPYLSVAQLKDALIQGADPVGGLNGLVASGGRLNAARTLQIVTGTTGNTGGGTQPSGQQWHVSGLSFATAHPYANNEDSTWVISDPGAQYMSLHFTNFHTEAGYDGAYLYDVNWNLVASYDGFQADFWSDPIPGDTVYFRLWSDGSVQRHGFDLDAFAGWY